MFTAKDFEVARAIKPGINLARLDPSAYAWLKIAQNANGSSTAYDAVIENGIAYFDRVTASQPLVSLLLNIPVTQTGSGTPSPDNIRDFIGVQGVNISRTGKNLTTIFTDGTVPSIRTGELVNSSGGRSNFVPVWPNTYYTFSTASVAQLLYIFYYDVNHGFISFDYLNTQTLTGKTPNNCAYIMLRTDLNASSIIDAQLEKSSTATPYEPYTGNTYQISFGQTVYSANLDVLTGKLSITHEIVDLGSLTWRYGSGSQVFYTEDITDMSEAIPFDNMACSAFETLNSNISLVNMTNYSIKRGKSESSMGTIYVKDTDYTDADAFTTAVTGMQLVYELAEPIEIQLTPTTVINTLIGENVIFADVANVTECKYTRK